jgi:hypothetical protein
MNAIDKVPSELEVALRGVVDLATAPHGGADVSLDYGLDHDGDECLRVVIAYRAAGNPLGAAGANDLNFRLLDLAARAGEQRLVYVAHQFHGNGPIIASRTKRSPQSRRA